MRYLGEYLEKAITIIQENDKDKAIEEIAMIFMEMELEMGYLEEKRKNSEEFVQSWLTDISKENDQKEELSATSE